MICAHIIIAFVGGMVCQTMAWAGPSEPSPSSSALFRAPPSTASIYIATLYLQNVKYVIILVKVRQNYEGKFCMSAGMSGLI